MGEAAFMDGDKGSGKLQLAALRPLDALSAKNLELVEEGVRYAQLPAGAEMYANMEAGWLIYLLEGRLVLRNAAGERLEVIDTSMGQPEDPVFADGVDDLTCKVLKPTKLLRIDKLHYQVLLSRQLDENTIVKDVSFEEQDALVFGRLYDAFAEQSLTVPSLPEVAIAVNKAAQDPDMDFVGLAAIIQRDPPYTARLIQTANSAAYRGAVKVDTLSGAVSRIGVEGSRNLIMSMAVDEMVGKVHAKAVAPLRAYYTEATEIAAICYALAVRAKCGVSSERALLAGLLHGLGMVPIINYACDSIDPVPAPQDVLRIAERLNEAVSAWLLSEWGLDDVLVDAAEGSSEWYRSVDAEGDLIALLIGARLLRYTALERDPPAELEKTPVGAWLKEHRLPVDRPDVTLALLNGDIETARQLLR